ncbi:MAG: tetratricopeptide repeat protein [Bdellovibrionales bacterium]|nr:tetratricopeptide repeat protein [Bdellovibrionales bacterium]
MGSQRNDEIWLIRSNGHILGPFTQKKVEELLREREIMVLDEACRPFKIWRPINELAQFAKIVEEVRIQSLDSSTDTDTSTTTNAIDDSMTLSVTENIDQDFNSDLTEEINVQNNNQEIVYNDIVEEKSAKTNSSKANKAPRFASEYSSEVQGEGKRTSFIMWGAVAILLVSFIGFYSYKTFLKSPIVKSQAGKAAIEKGLAAFDVGDYEQALTYFKKAYESNPENKDIYIYYGALLIQVERQTFAGRSILQKVITNNLEHQKLAHTGIGLSYLIENDTRKAREEFNKALSMDSSYLPAVINLGVSKFQENNIDAAIADFKRALSIESNNPIASLLLARSYAKKWSDDKTPELLESALQHVDYSSDSQINYSLEAQVVEAYIHSLGYKFSKATESIKKAIDMDLDMTEDHRQNIFIDQRFLSWSSLEFWCQAIVSQVDDTEEVKTFESICHYKNSQLNKAKALAENAVNQNPTHPAILSYYSKILKELKMNLDASTTLSAALRQNSERQYIIPHIMQGRFCLESKDYDCAVEQFQKALDINANNLGALAGMAEVLFYKNEKVSAKEYYNKANKISSQYKPLLKLKKKMN